jgi:isocitrate dehydrogenase kinase/phosphatase
MKTKKLLYRLGKYLVKRYCEHKNKKIIFYDYQERCYIYECLDCQERVYIGMDS